MRPTHAHAPPTRVVGLTTACHVGFLSQWRCRRRSGAFLRVSVGPYGWGNPEGTMLFAFSQRGTLKIVVHVKLAHIPSVGFNGPLLSYISAVQLLWDPPGYLRRAWRTVSSRSATLSFLFLTRRICVSSFRNRSHRTRTLSRYRASQGGLW